LSANAPALPGAPAESRARAWYVLAVLVLVYAVNFIDRNILSVLLQPIKEEMQVSDTWMGLLTGPAFAIFYTFAGIPIARVADRGSRVVVMAVGIAFWSLMTAVSGQARSFAQLAAARVGVGVGEASATPAAHSLLSDYFPPRQRTRALAIYNGGASLGVLFGLLLGGWLATSVGWRMAFAVVGLPGLLVALLVWLTVPEPRRGTSEGRVDAGDPPGLGETLRYLLAMPSFRHVAVATALYSIAAYCLLGWAPTFMLRVHGLSLAEIGLKLGLVIGIAGAVGQYAGGVLCDRLSLRDRRWLVWIPARPRPPPAGLRHAGRHSAQWPLGAAVRPSQPASGPRRRWGCPAAPRAPWRLPVPPSCAGRWPPAPAPPPAPWCRR
jgi:predicted MFS family arabinose efflux permease